LKTSFHVMISPFPKKLCYVTLLLILKVSPSSSRVISSFDGAKMLNENSTFLYPQTTISQNATAGGDVKDFPWLCHCSTDLEENENESECHCEGPKLLKVPQNLPQITRLSMANAKFKVLREAGLRKYSSSLRDL
jgi:hypothetical protein